MQVKQDETPIREINKFKKIVEKITKQIIKINHVVFDLPKDEFPEEYVKMLITDLKKFPLYNR